MYVYKLYMHILCIHNYKILLYWLCFSQEYIIKLASKLEVVSARFAASLAIVAKMTAMMKKLQNESRRPQV